MHRKAIQFFLYFVYDFQRQNSNRLQSHPRGSKVSSGGEGRGREKEETEGCYRPNLESVKHSRSRYLDRLKSRSRKLWQSLVIFMVMSFIIYMRNMESGNDWLFELSLFFIYFSLCQAAFTILSAS